MPSLNIKDYILMALLLIIFGLLYTNSSLKDDIKDLQLNIAKLNEKVGIYKANNKTLEASILKQNMKIQKIEIDKQEAIKKYLSEKQRRVAEIEKLMKGIKSDECEDVKSILDSVRTFQP